MMQRVPQGQDAMPTDPPEPPYASRHVVIAEISNGLGNQMFQYAAARRLALANQAPLWLLRGGNFEAQFQRAFDLEKFNIAGRVIDQSSPEWALCPPARLPTIKEPSIWDFIGSPATSAPLLYTPSLLTWRGGAYLSGFWQNEHYFADQAASIRQDLTLKAPLGEQNAACLARIRAAPSAFLHVRRGDYAQAGINDLFGTCGLDYYAKALDALRARHGQLNIFVFSDDPAWVREHQIGGATAEIIDWNGAAPELDLTLMRHCQHAVIANSTFSWWGAWLGDHPGRTTIAPQIWIKAVPHFSEITPPRWLRL